MAYPHAAAYTHALAHSDAASHRDALADPHVQRSSKSAADRDARPRVGGYADAQPAAGPRRPAHAHGGARPARDRNLTACTYRTAN
jgi:hypothetical protein